MQIDSILTENDIQAERKSCVNACSIHKKHRSNISYSKENKDSLIIKQVPSDHYIESRFFAYNQAKVYNKPLFSDISKSQSAEKSSSISRFRSSRYPQVPLTKEFLEKVQKINTFRESFSCKRPRKKDLTHREVSKAENKHLNKNLIVLSLKTWDSVKQQCFKNKETDFCHMKTILLEERFKKHSVLSENHRTKSSIRDSPYL